MPSDELRQTVCELISDKLIAVYRFRRDPDGRYFFDYLSEMAIRLLGFSPDVPYTTEVLEFEKIPASERAAFIESIEKSAQNLSRWDYVFPYDTGKDQLQYYRARSLPEKLADGTIIWTGYFLDVTDGTEQSLELKNAQAQLQRQTELLTESQEVAKLGSWEIDADTLTPKWSSEVCRILEVDTEESDSPVDLAEAISYYAPEHQEIISRAVQQAFLDGTPFDLELQVEPRESRRRKWVRAIGHAEQRDGEVTRIYGIFQDIDERRRNEEALRESQQRLDLAVQGGQLGLWDFNVLTGKGFVNDRWVEMLGLDGQSFKPDIDFWHSHLHRDDSKRVLEAFDAHLKGESQFFKEEYRLRHADGHWIWVTNSGQVTRRTESGEPLRISGMMLDITASKIVEESLRESMTIAEAANRSKDEFLAMMSHELRTPLNGIMGFAEILRNTDLDEEQLEFVQMVRSSGAQLMDIITDILDFSRLQARKMDLRIEEFPLERTVTSAVNTLQPMAESKGISLDLTIDRKLPQRLRQDGERVKQIINNLVSNAVKFTDHGGVKVELELDSDPEVNDWLVIRVIDTGVGIPEDKREILFEPFMQVDSSLTRRHGGTGLGLSIVKKLCDLLNGSVKFTSKLDSGSTFVVRLPIEYDMGSARHEDRKITTPMPKSLAQRHPLQILVVEDDAINARLIGVVLKRLEYAPAFARNGQEALELLKKQPVDLVLMDVQMPVMDGYEATRLIRAGVAGDHLKNIYVVGLTALALPQDHEKCLESGMNICLTKPLKSHTLVQTLQKVADHISKEKSGDPVSGG